MVFSQSRTVTPAQMVFTLKQVFGLSDTDRIKLNGWLSKCIALWCDIYHWNKCNSKQENVALMWCMELRPPQVRLPSNLQYKPHLSTKWNCRSLRCSWSIACRRCSNYIFILGLTPGSNGLGKHNYKMRQESFKLRYLVRLISEISRYIYRQI